MKERNTSLDALKGFAILLVMIGHVLILNKINDPYVYRVIESVQMPLFIMISGYLSGLRPPIDKFSQWKNTMSKRAFSYLVPFFAWLLLKQWDDLARGFWNTMIQLDRGLWFLMTLFVLNLVLYTAQVLSTIFRKMGKWQGFVGFCGMFGLMSGVFMVQLILKITFLSPELTLRYIPPFLAGYLVSTYKDELIRIWNNKLQLGLFLVCLSVFAFRCANYDYKAPLVIQVVEGLMGSYVIFYLFLKSKKNVIKEKLAWLGQYTLEIYAIHFHFADKLNPGKIHYELYSIEGLLFAIASFTLMSAATAGLIYMAKQTPLTDLFLFGKRSIRVSKDA